MEGADPTMRVSAARGPGLSSATAPRWGMGGTPPAGDTECRMRRSAPRGHHARRLQRRSGRVWPASRITPVDAVAPGVHRIRGPRNDNDRPADDSRGGRCRDDPGSRASGSIEFGRDPNPRARKPWWLQPSSFPALCRYARCRERFVLARLDEHVSLLRVSDVPRSGETVYTRTSDVKS